MPYTAATKAGNFTFKCKGERHTSKEGPVFYSGHPGPFGNGQKTRPDQVVYGSKVSSPSIRERHKVYNGTRTQVVCSCCKPATDLTDGGELLCEKCSGKINHEITPSCEDSVRRSICYVNGNDMKQSSLQWYPTQIETKSYRSGTAQREAPDGHATEP